MKAILLDGSNENDRTGERVRAALAEQLKVRGWDAEHVILRQKKIGVCAGDFFCFVRTPGVCNADDDNRAIAAAIVASDLLVYLTPVTFAGYSSRLKRMVDHQMQNVSAFFTRVRGETHHAKRYRNNPDFLVVGWTDAPDVQSEAVFRHLVQRNALNWHSRTHVSAVVLSSQPDGEMQASAQKWLDDLHSGQSSQRVELPANGETDNGTIEMRRALLLVGSPKTRKSTSNSLGRYLFDRLGTRSVETETIYLHTVLRSASKMQTLLEEVDAADLVVLAFPVYVDSLPAPVIEALETVAGHRQTREGSRRQLFAAIGNCGFPEAFQAATALAICETFARQAGFVWAGALALGGGQMLNGMPLAQAGGMAVPICRALELAAEALAQGRAIPSVARDSLAKPIVPHWVYWLMSWFRWISWARHYGAIMSLKRQPYLAKARLHGP